MNLTSNVPTANCAVTAVSSTGFTAKCDTQPSQVYWIAIARTDADNFVP